MVSLAAVGFFLWAKHLTDLSVIDKKTSSSVLRSSISSEIHAYFPDRNLPSHWGNFYGLMRNFYLYTYANDPATRTSRLDQIRHYFDVHGVHDPAMWAALSGTDRSSNSYRQAWEALDARDPPDLAALGERGIAATRQLAKRQVPWLRSMPHRHVVQADAPDVEARLLATFEALAGPPPARRRGPTQGAAGRYG